jgi:hypothetical protein
MNLNINLTWSKIMALLVLMASVYLETLSAILLDKSFGCFIASLTSVTVLLTGRQLVNGSKEVLKQKQENTNAT